MVRGKGTTKEVPYVSASEIETITDEKRELESVLREIEGGTGIGNQGSSVDVNRIKRELAHLNSVLDAAKNPEKISGKSKDLLADEERELEEELKAGMPTQWEMRKPSLNPGAVKKHIRWGERNFANIQRYVEIQRKLRPDEPKSIENLRRER